MATILNNRENLATDPIRNFRFLVRFLPHNKAGIGTEFSPTLGFTQVSGLSVTTQAIPYREGSMNSVVHQIPGQSTFSPVTMQRGVVVGSKQNWDWMKSLFAVVSGDGLRGIETSFRCDVEIAVLQHPVGKGTQTVLEKSYTGGDDGWGGQVPHAMNIKLFNAWITSLAYSDLNAGDSAFLVEQISLVHEGMDITFGPKSNIGTSADPTFVSA